MSRHVPRHERWSKLGPNEYRSGSAVVRYDKGAWWALVSYRRRDEAAAADAPAAWQDQSERLGPFTGRSADVGVVLDLMIHDLDLVLALVGAPVRAVEAVGVSVFGRHEDVANARLHFADGCVATLTASRANPMPRRCMHVWAPEGYARVDFAGRRLTLMQPSEDVRRHGLDPSRLEPSRSQAMMLLLPEE